jgi:hypothetical protein
MKVSTCARNQNTFVVIRVCKVLAATKTVGTEGLVGSFFFYFLNSTIRVAFVFTKEDSIFADTRASP